MLRALRLLTIVAIAGVVATSRPNIAYSSSLDSRDHRELQRLRDREVIVAVWHQTDAAAWIGENFGDTAHRFSFIDTTLARVPASTVLAVAGRPSVRDIEILDNGLAHGAYNLLQRLELLHRYRRMGHFPFSAVNLSLSPDRKLVNKLPFRTGERTMRRAISAISVGLNIPVFMAVGNDGPAVGFVNPWAKAPGVFAVTAADRDGSTIFNHANRPKAYAGTEDWHLFAAWGVNTVGALDRRVEKSSEMLEVEKRIDLPALVGEENVDFYSVRSGTSFASPNLLAVVCPLHQVIEHLAQTVDATHALSLTLRPFIRAIVDTSIDEEHPIFRFRLADKRQKHSGLEYQIDPQYKQELYKIINGTGIDLKLRFDTEVAYRFFKRIARPVPGAEGADGHGFVSFEDGMAFIRAARVSDLIDILADPDNPEVPVWHKGIVKAGDPVLHHEG